MDTIISQMFHAISAIMFCVAITILFTAVDISSDILTTATQLNQKEGVEQYVPSAGDVSLISFAELIMRLMRELNGMKQVMFSVWCLAQEALSKPY